MAGCDRAVLFGADPARVRSAIISEAVMVALIVEKLYGLSVGAPRQYYGKTRKTGGVGKPAKSAEHRALIGHCERDLGPLCQRWNRFLP